MASKYYGYWKCEYHNRSMGKSWQEYYFVRTSDEWYYFDGHRQKWYAAWSDTWCSRIKITFRSHMGYNTNPLINVDGPRLFRKIPPLEVVVVCGGLCKKKRRNRNAKRVSKSS